MIEVAPNLFVGNAVDEAATKNLPGWYIVSAAKEPWHRAALGYTGRAAPRDDPEYLIAKRDNRLILNLVDANDPAFISSEIIGQALHETHVALRDGKKVLIHCNQGASRSPTIALLYLAVHDKRFEGMSFDAASDLFRTIYPAYEPARGMAEYAKQHWPHQDMAIAG